MRHRILVIATAALLGAAAIGYLAWRTSRPSAPVPTAIPAPVAKTPLPASAPPHLRRLVMTRLRQPRDLRFDGVHTVATQKFGTLTCGRLAWSDITGGARDFKRFVATRHNLILEGQANFERAWMPCGE